jgi:hypothetical protein
MNGRIGRFVAALGERRSLARRGFGIRLDWPDGTHTFAGIWPGFQAAERAARRDHAFWRHGPICPLRWHVVVLTRFEVRAHTRRRFCRDAACPAGPVVIGRRQEARS